MTNLESSKCEMGREAYFDGQARNGLNAQVYFVSSRHFRHLKKIKAA
jgi:hypothetical protein